MLFAKVQLRCVRSHSLCFLFTVQVDQDVDVPWPLEVYGHNGKAANVTMEPGDMVLYESHSVIHGRPFPMQGRFYANFFIHFEVLGPLEGESSYDPSLGLPPYLIPGSKWEGEWRKNNPKGWSKVSTLFGDTGSKHTSSSGSFLLSFFYTKVV